MPDSLVLSLIAAPGAIALAWVLAQVTVLRYVRARKTAERWPALGEALGLSAFEPPRTGRTRYWAGLRGTHRGRPVELRAGITKGSGQRSSATEHTTWVTGVDVGLRIQDTKVLGKLLPQGDAQTGDAEFDRAFRLEEAQPGSPPAPDASRP